MKKPELLAPAGDMEKLKIAIHFGADAVYLSGKRFGLRSAAANFSIDEMRDAVAYAHERDVKIYITVNIFFHNRDLEGIEEYLCELSDIGVDAVIISDPGIIALAREVIPDMEIHLSTQANSTNWRSAAFWKSMGISRVNMARELSLEEIKEVSSNTDIEIETFVHGAVCMAYSGRCHLSSHMTGRDANYGECTHSCRWEYSITEAKRPSERFDMEEDERGTYFFNSRDLCMIEHIPELLSAGTDSLKIEGRVKGINYVAGAVRSYRLAIDSYLNDPEGYTFKEEWLDELRKLSHRDYDTGFYLGREALVSGSSSYVRKYDFVGVIKERIGEGSFIVEARNKIMPGDHLEIMSRGEDIGELDLGEIISPDGEAMACAQPKQQFILTSDIAIEPMDIIRKEKALASDVLKKAV
ncbi:MAG: U32 family peptidase [Proteobacteria bacterium]|nr:U32 family peptidase [Pseudomonadota bacterium]